MIISLFYYYRKWLRVEDPEIMIMKSDDFKEEDVEEDDDRLVRETLSTTS